MTTTTNGTISGAHLRQLREQADVSKSALGRAYGVRRQTIQNLERYAAVQPLTAQKYLAALMTVMGSSDQEAAI